MYFYYLYLWWYICFYILGKLFPPFKSRSKYKDILKIDSDVDLRYFSIDRCIGFCKRYEAVDGSQLQNCQGLREGGREGGNLPQVLGAPRNFLLGPSPFFWVKYFRA
jgi:hypothetical protein